MNKYKNDNLYLGWEWSPKAGWLDKESAGSRESACVGAAITTLTQEVAGQSGMRFGRANFMRGSVRGYSWKIPHLTCEYFMYRMSTYVNNNLIQFATCHFATWAEITCAVRFYFLAGCFPGNFGRGLPSFFFFLLFCVVLKTEWIQIVIPIRWWLFFGVFLKLINED